MIIINKPDAVIFKQRHLGNGLWEWSESTCGGCSIRGGHEKNSAPKAPKRGIEKIAPKKLKIGEGYKNISSVVLSKLRPLRIVEGVER